MAAWVPILLVCVAAAGDPACKPMIGKPLATRPLCEFAVDVSVATAKALLSAGDAQVKGMCRPVDDDEHSAKPEEWPASVQGDF